MPPWRYQLVSGSYLLDDCPVCGRPSVQEPMRGTFTLRLLETNPLFSRFAVENIRFTAGAVRTYTVTGSGTFQTGGEVAIVQQMALQVEIDDGITKKRCDLKNSSPAPAGLWPMIGITLEQTNGTILQTYTLRLSAAPLREIWFSTTNKFTAGSGEPGTISAGDLLSSTGRVVKRASWFCGALSPMPPCPDLGLDAADILPGGEIAYSIEQNIFSERLGPLQHGDVVTSHGRILRRNSELLAAFDPAAPAADAGLDAVHVPDTGAILFSIESDIVSKALNTTLRRGDILSSSGQVVRTHRQLLSRFQPPAALADCGLDALYVWPGGEIWFSTEQGFQDQVLGPVLGGDILSDQGYIVYRNLDLLNVFAPLEDAAEFGLDVLYVITDSTPPPPGAQFEMAVLPATGSIRLSWRSAGRVFQVERSSDLSDSFQPVSPVIPDPAFTDPGAMNGRRRAFYKLRQW